MHKRVLVCALGLVCFLGGSCVLAEDAPVAPPAPGGQNGQGGGGGRRWDPEQFRQRMQERLKEALGTTEDEWKALQPKIDAVQKLVFQARAGGFGRFGRRGGPPGGGDTANPQPPQSESEKKVNELQALADNKDADPKAIKEKLQALRDMREKAKADLKKAQDELRELLTPRQEAQLVLFGLLD